MNDEAFARRTAVVLAASQAIVGSAAPVAISLGALAGFYLLDADKSLATAPVTGYNVGVALGAIPAALVIRSLGTRGGFMFGTCVTALAGVASTLALVVGNFWFFAASLGLLGVGGAFVQKFRFVAADNAPPAFKPRAISFVLAGGIITAVVGPQVVIFTRDLLAPVPFAGAFAFIVVLAAIGAMCLSFLPRQAQFGTGAARTVEPARPLPEIVSQPRFIVALLCGVGSYALMSFVMTGAPLAMVGCGFSTDEAALGISWHIMAMFGPSFVTGRIIQFFGVERVVAFGLALLVVCAAVALSGIQLWQFWTALILLGLGWNFAFIGATSMVAASYRPSEKDKAQGFHDFILFGSVAFGSLMSGVAYNAGGWSLINWAVFPVVLLCFLGLGWLRLITPHTSDAPARPAH